MMYRCERCGSAFNPIPFFSQENCPRCRMRDGVSVPLTLDERPRGGSGGSELGTERAPDDGEAEGP
jgi:hypothetical protein